MILLFKIYNISFFYLFKGIILQQEDRGYFMEEQKFDDDKEKDMPQEHQLTQEEVSEIESQLANRMAIQRTAKNGANWFYWICGLSILNTIIYSFGGKMSFIFGLGATNLTDVFIGELFDNPAFIQIVVSVALSSIYIICGYFANKGFKAAFIVGAVLYILDAIIYIVLGEFLDVAFHAFALYEIYKGIKASKLLNS